MSAGAAELVRGWVRAAREASVAAELSDVYAQVSAEVERRGPVCWASGRCCNFKKTGHLLYVTGLEAAFTLVRRGSPGLALVAESVTTGGCPFQVMNLCGAHADKPLGCRVYFCDRTAQEWQNELYERMLGLLRGVHSRYGVEYRYGEWRMMMRTVLEHAGSELAAWAPHDDGRGGGGGVTLTVNGH
ncbi:MAG: hypothetical protein QM783_19585 [Phycisphaerales bacterium]